MTFSFVLPDALSWTGNDETLTPQEVFLQVTWELRHLAESIRVNLIRPEPSGGKKFIMLDPKSSSDASYVEKRHRPFGRCYMIHPEHWIRELGISSIEVA